MYFCMACDRAPYFMRDAIDHCANPRMTNVGTANPGLVRLQENDVEFIETVRWRGCIRSV